MIEITATAGKRSWGFGKAISVLSAIILGVVRGIVVIVDVIAALSTGITLVRVSDRAKTPRMDIGAVGASCRKIPFRFAVVVVVLERNGRWKAFLLL